MQEAISSQRSAQVKTLMTHLLSAVRNRQRGTSGDDRFGTASPSSHGHGRPSAAGSETVPLWEPYTSSAPGRSENSGPVSAPPPSSSGPENPGRHSGGPPESAGRTWGRCPAPEAAGLPGPSVLPRGRSPDAAAP